MLNEFVKRARLLFLQWKTEISNNKKLILLSIIFLIIALFLNNISGNYTTKKADVSVADIILDNVPIINFSFIYYYGALVIILVTFFYVLFFRVKKIHVAISQFSLLLIIRSFFICLTHLKVPEGAIFGHPPFFYHFLLSQNDLFFSGHTAFPFLLFLIFRKEKIGIFFLIATFVMAVSVLLMHVHYSIDVFAAFFIAYGSYKIGNILFRRIDY